jgi:hypothetical protein
MVNQGWLVPVFPAFEKLRQENLELKASSGLHSKTLAKKKQTNK